MKSTYILDIESKMMEEYWQYLQSVFPIIENSVNSCGNNVKEKALILHPTNLEHSVLCSNLTMVLKLMLRKKSRNLYLLMSQKSNY